jgi:aldose 1-epimerase
MDRCFTGLTGSSADIGDLTLSWRGPITQVVVYSGDAGYVCVEPVTMANDGIRMADEGIDGTGVIALDPGASLTVGYRLTWPLP